MPIKNLNEPIKDLHLPQRIGITNQLKFIRSIEEPNKFIIEWQDTELSANYATIQLHEYEKKPQIPHGSAHDIFVGVMGELLIEKNLREKEISFEYAQRKLNILGSTDQRKFDFKLANGETLEIVTLKPGSYFAEIKDTNWKQSSYAIVVKLNSLNCSVEIYEDGKYRIYDMKTKYGDIQQTEAFIRKPTSEKIGEVEILGYDTLDNIMKAVQTPTDETIIEPSSGWFYSALNQQIKTIDCRFNGTITPEAAARCIRIKPNSQLLNIENLWEELKNNR